MMEKNTDRLFWTLTSIIVGALLLTISVKAFPQVTSSIVKPISGIVKQEDKAGHGADDAANSAFGASYTLDNRIGAKNQSNPEEQAKANAVEASSLGFAVSNNGDGTGTLTKYDASKGLDVTIPSYVKVNGSLVKITKIGNFAFAAQPYLHNQITSVTIPDTIVSIGYSAFNNNNLTSVNIPNSVTDIGLYAFSRNKIKNVNISNKQLYIIARDNPSFDYGVNLTNNPSSN